MTRVAHLTSVHQARDPRIFLKECVTLADAGHEVILVAPGAEEPGERGVRFVDYPRVSGRLKRFLGNGRRMARTATALKADIYHFHDPELLPAGSRLAKRGQLVIYDAHEHLTNSTRGKDYLAGWLSELVARAAGAYESRVAARVSAVVAATPTIAQQFDPDNTVVVANYPRVEQWAQTEPTLANYRKRRPLAVYIGGISPQRNAGEMLECANLLSHVGAGFAFAGRLEGTEVPSGPNVEYSGVLQPPALTELLAAARVGVSVLKPIPNYVDSLPTKTFEYMAAGLPVVVSEETVVQARIVEEAECGLVVPHDSPRRMAEAIDQLLDDPVSAFDMGMRGRAAVLKDYSWAPQGAKLLALYDSLLATKTGTLKAT